MRCSVSSTSTTSLEIKDSKSLIKRLPSIENLNYLKISSNKSLRDKECDNNFVFPLGMGIFKESNTRREFEKIKKSKSILKKTTSEEDNQKMLQEKFKKKIRDSAEVLREKRNRDKVKTNIKREYRRNSPCKSIVVSENIDSIHYSMDNTISKKTCPCCVEEEVMRTGKIFQRIQIFEKIH